MNAGGARDPIVTDLYSIAEQSPIVTPVGDIADRDENCGSTAYDSCGSPQYESCGSTAYDWSSQYESCGSTACFGSAVKSEGLFFSESASSADSGGKKRKSKSGSRKKGYRFLYLPFEIDEMVVLQAKGDAFLVETDSCQVQTASPIGLAYRKNMNLEKIVVQILGPAWGDTVEGVVRECEDGTKWLEVNGQDQAEDTPRRVRSHHKVEASDPAAEDTPRLARRTQSGDRKPPRSDRQKIKEEPEQPRSHHKVEASDPAAEDTPRLVRRTQSTDRKPPRSDRQCELEEPMGFESRGVSEPTSPNARAKRIGQKWLLKAKNHQKTYRAESEEPEQPLSCDPRQCELEEPMGFESRGVSEPMPPNARVKSVAQKWLLKAQARRQSVHDPHQPDEPPPQKRDPRSIMMGRRSSTGSAPSYSATPLGGSFLLHNVVNLLMDTQELSLEEWRVIYYPSVRVRVSPSLDARELERKDFGSIVWGFEENGWVKLDSEPGFIMVRDARGLGGAHLEKMYEAEAEAEMETDLSTMADSPCSPQNATDSNTSCSQFSTPSADRIVPVSPNAFGMLPYAGASTSSAASDHYSSVPPALTTGIKSLQMLSRASESDMESA